VLKVRLNRAIARLSFVPPDEALDEPACLVEDSQQALDPETPDHAIALTLYGKALLQMRAHRAEAPAPIERALAILTAKLPPDHFQLVNQHGQLGEALLENQRFADAEPHLLKLLDFAERRPSPDPGLLREALAMHGRALLGLHRAREARSELERAVSLHDPAENPRDTALEQFALACALAETGAGARARVLARAAEAGFVAHPIDDDERLAAVRAWLRAH
jgi:hypothetical protein